MLASYARNSPCLTRNSGTMNHPLHRPPHPATAEPREPGTAVGWASRRAPHTCGHLALEHAFFCQAPKEALHSPALERASVTRSASHPWVVFLASLAWCCAWFLLSGVCRLFAVPLQKEQKDRVLARWQKIAARVVWGIAPRPQPSLRGWAPQRARGLPTLGETRTRHVTGPGQFCQAALRVSAVV